jgi:tyrocidine synthetase-3
LTLEGLRVQPYEIAHTISKFDLSLSVREAEGYLECQVEYAIALFERSTIQQMMKHFAQIVQAMVQDPEQRIVDIDMLTQEEKQQILVEWNETVVAYPAEQTLHGLFEQQVAQTPERIALVCENEQLTYRELNRRANRVARVLRHRGVQPDDRVGVCMERSPEMIVSILAILKAGGAYVPIAPDYPVARIGYMLEDSAAQFVLSQPKVISELQMKTPNCEWLDIEEVEQESVDRSNLPWVNRSTDLAYVIYTSGTTGQPKGVMIEHHSVINRVGWMADQYQITAEDVLLQKTPTVFDVSVWELFMWFFVGAKLCLLPPGGEKSPQTIIDTIADHQVTTIHFVPSMFQVFLGFVDQAAEAEKEKLASLKRVFTSGEALTTQQVALFRQTLHAAHQTELHNLYGPTEATVDVSYYPCPMEGKLHCVPIGKPIQNTQLYVLSPSGQVQPVGVPGELYIAGVGLARGYLGKPELTAEKFVPNPFTPGERMYRTGDLARFLPDGNIEFLGRIDHQVKIRGYRIELGEIESALTKHPQVKAATVRDWRDQQQEAYLCAYVVLDQPITTSELKRYLGQKLPSYMIPAFIVELEAIPLTPNGKVNRRALPQPDAGELQEEYVAPETELEQKLAELWQAVLDMEHVSVTASFFQVGGHSLKAIQLISLIHQQLQVELSVRDIFTYPTIQQLANHLQEQETTDFQAIVPAPVQTDYPVSSAQKRIYVLQQMEPEATHYNMPGAVVLEGALDQLRLQHAFQALIERHESLRTSFVMIEGELRQKVQEVIDFSLPSWAGTEAEASQRMKDFVQPFVLTEAPLLRAELVQLTEERHLLLLDLHHIIADGVSIDVLLEDLSALYRGESLPALRIQYKDFAVWEQEWRESEAYQKQEQYWLKQLDDELPTLELPTDHPRPEVQDFAGDAFTFELDQEVTKALHQLANETGATPYMLLLTAYNVLLHKYTGQTDIIVGSPVVGRPHADVQRVLGMFVNTLAIRNQLEGNKRVVELIAEVKAGALAAYEHADYPFEALVEALSLEQDTSRNPVFQTMFSMQDFGRRHLTLEGLRVQPYEIANTISKFDLSLFVREAEGALECQVEYATALFERSTIQQMMKHFAQIVQAMVQDSEQRIADIDMLTQEEKQQILVEWNDTAVDYAVEKTFQAVFEEQAEKTPYRIAVVDEHQQLTYHELNQRANRVARVLRQHGVKPDDRVGLFIERSVNMIVGLLAILKSGGAYVPIDPEYPAERIRYMLQDSRAALVLGQHSIMAPFQEEMDQVAWLDIRQAMKQEMDASNLSTVNHPTDLAYVIYTSGTTGQPKGVMIEHKSVINLVRDFQAKFGIQIGDRVGQFASPSFDAFAWEVSISLLSGASLYMIPRETILDSGAFEQYVAQHQLSVMLLPPPYLSHLHREKMPSLRKLVVGGSASTPQLVEEWQGIYINAYGPTEGTVCATTWEPAMDQPLQVVPIGRPLANQQIYIVNDAMQLQPVGVPGELCISGIGLARGYLGKPELSAEKFVPNPFISGERMYRTGDLARYLPDGNIEFLGRIDHQVKIRGYRIEMGEIESVLMEHPGVKEATVCDWQDEQQEAYLCAYVVLDQPVSTSELKHYLGQKLPSYMVPAFIMELDTIPLTPNGKVNRRALSKPDSVELQADYVAPKTELEKKLATIWQEVLGMDRISVTASFFQIGGHSLNAIQLISLLHQQLQVELSVRDIFTYPTIRQMADLLQDQETTDFQTILPAPVQADYPVSSAQKRIYVLQQMEPKATHYNMPGALMLEGPLDRQRLEEAFQALIQRHESLRTSFAVIGGELRQKVQEEIDFSLPVWIGTEAEASQRMKEFVQPFALTHAPLLRAELIQLSQERHLLLLDLHHIIADGVSIEVLLEDLSALYRGESLPALRIQYKDFAVWEQAWRQSEEYQKQEQYWLQQLDGELPTLELPTDHPRPEVQDFAGDSYTFAFDQELTEALHQLANKTGATPYMLLLAAYNVLLHKYTGQTDIIVGSPVVGRSHADVQRVLGMFVNTLAMRNQLEGNKRVVELIAEVKAGALAAYEQADYPFEALVEALSLTQDTSRNPVFQTLFSMQDFGSQSLKLDGLRVQPYEIESSISKFDLSLFVREEEGRLECFVEYATALFERRTIERMMQHFAQIVKAMVHDPEQRIADMDMLTQQEKQQLLVEWNETAVDYPNKPIQAVFEQQVIKSPYRVALVYQNKQWTYLELNQRANRVARALRRQGIQPNDCVGLYMERSPEMIVGILAILKAGGAYVPIDPDYPTERIRYMLEDSAIQVVLSQSHRVETFQEGIEHSIPCLDVQALEASEVDASNLPSVNQSTHLAYVMYTSGTTGQPKGVKVPHQGVVRLVKGANYAELHADQVFLQLAPMSFDASTFEVWGSLLNGAKLIMMESHRPSLKEIATKLRNEQVTTLWLTAGLFKLMVDYDLASLKGLQQLLVGGDVLSVPHVQKVLQLGSVQVINGYGPTENTTFTCCYRIPKDWQGHGSLPIGRPISNTQVYILDAYHKPVPIGVVGELYVSGDGLAQGYMGKEELTQEKFIENPFVLGKRMYRTGDLVRYLPDGNMEFFGRVDQQVKVRGHRIEPSEIEVVLMTHPQVQDAVVRDWQDDQDETYLCAYVVLQGSISIEQVKEYLSQKLPSYMVPSFVIELDKIPVTANGKVDRKALPQPDQVAQQGEHVAPTTELEKQLVAIWQDVLGVERVGVTDHFFELGGHSLKAILLVSQIEERMKQKVAISSVFQYPTIREFAQAVLQAEEKETNFVTMLSPSQNKNLFCFPPIAGYGVIFKEMAKRIDTHIVYGFDFLAAEDRVDRYIDTIVRLQKEGPYVLLGYSAGCALIFEVAQEMERRGYEVSNLIMLDGAAQKEVQLVPEEEVQQQAEESVEDFLQNELKSYASLFNKPALIQRVKDYYLYLNQLVNKGQVQASIHLITSETEIPHITAWREKTPHFYSYQGAGEHSEMVITPHLEKNVELIQNILMRQPMVVS